MHDPLQDTTKSLSKKEDNKEELKEFKFQKYSRVFGPNSTINDVFIGSDFSDYAESLFLGHKHVCVFYGQTGSGKTYNLMGENNFDLEK